MGVHASRERLYSSLEELSGDSSAVVLGEVVDQGVMPGSPSESTLSTVRVVRTYDPPGLGEERGAVDVEVGSDVRLRQTRSSGMAEIPAPILERGATYLLFLTPSGLEGDAAGDYFITGGQPGYFAVDGSAFVRVVTDSDDTLPVRITEEDLRGSTATR